MLKQPGRSARDSAAQQDSTAAHSDPPTFSNRLAQEKSPYLRQHAHNPVAWHPWGTEAFTRARDEDKPVFLSVGYSTCHWCHVMERESFENQEIARILNAHFVAIKVDREERPDVDRVYMTFVQAVTGGGGWPMSVWLTPDLKPFVGGTYYPPEERWGRPGLKSILLHIAEAWKNNRHEIVAAANQAIQQLQEYLLPRPTNRVEPGAALLDAAFQKIAASYEPHHGGFGGAPKFPRPVVLNFLLRYHARTGAHKALEMTLFTLHKMAQGGIHDHIGGGFHRYAVDNEWHVPHFEKMLYDQAQLACSYLEAYQITHDAFYCGVARDILRYVLHDMTGEQGQFYSAEDADSEGIEGKFYVWEQPDIAACLGIKSAEIFNYHYGVEAQGNVRNDPHSLFHNQNVLIVRHNLQETAENFAMSTDSVDALLAHSRSTLQHLRALRPRPFRDDKTLTSWNGLMISAFARAAQVLATEEKSAPSPPALSASSCLAAAVRAARFIAAGLYDRQKGKLWRCYREGDASIDAFVDDYAFLIQGLIDLYEASFDMEWLKWAIELQTQQDALFHDSAKGGYFSTTGQDSHVLLRMKDDYDGAEPSPNSVTALNLLRLSNMTGESIMREQACAIFSAFSGRLHDAPDTLPQMLAALDFHLAEPKQIIIAGRPNAQDTMALLHQIHGRFIPNKIILLADGDSALNEPDTFSGFLKNIVQINGQATAYLCENGACKIPTSDPAELASGLAQPG